MLPHNSQFSIVYIKQLILFQSLYLYSLHSSMHSNPTELITQQTIRILLKHQQPTSNIRCESYMNSDIHYYFVFLQEVSTTMLLSENFDRDLIQERRVIIFVAERQNSGKGRKNNKWQSPSGNIYMTILSKIQFQILPLLCLIAAVTICQEVEASTGLKFDIKWVNDLFVEGLKIGGILVNSDMMGLNSYGQVGIGLNIASAPLETSTFLKKFLKQDIDKDQLIKRIVFNLGKKLHRKQTEQQRETILDSYSNRLLFKGEYINIFDETLTNVLHHGKFKGINEYGFAIVEEEGKQIIVSNGRMRNIPQ